jgi:nitronate monooxygenase
MAGANGAAMASAVSAAGGLGSLPCAMLDAAAVRTEVDLIRATTTRPFNINFFCHTPASPDPEREAAWKKRLAPFYVEYGLDPDQSALAPVRTPFDQALCELVEEIVPAVVSFHFGLPALPLLERVRQAGCRVISSATSVAEACWLEARGCDAVIAQGVEAGGHRGMFLDDRTATQVGTLALVPQVVDAVSIPVIAAGGIADGRGIAAAFALGASGVQIGTAYLLTPESLISDLHRAALLEAADDGTALTNLFSGRPARSVVNRVMREIGPMSTDTPAFPTAGAALAPLKTQAEATGAADFSSLWSGQAGPLARDIGSGELTRSLADETLQSFRRLGGWED